MSDEQLTRERDELRADVERLRREHTRTWNKLQRQRENLTGLNASLNEWARRARWAEAELAKLREERQYRCWPENMPPLMGPYLVMRAGGGQAVAFLQWGEWYWRPGKRLTDVTHWTHLPAPPGEKGE